jgi:hypothetical protein
MNVCLLRVGIDTGSGGALGPIWKDRTFEFIPIPELTGETSAPTYADLPAMKAGRLSQYVPKLSKTPAHADPEFDTFTYGDYSHGPKGSLKNLSLGDILAFYAGPRPLGETGRGGLYLIGYFEVEMVREASSSTKADLQSLFPNNFHVKHRNLV